MSGQVGVGVVGLGFVGAGAHLPAFQKMKQANLVAISDVNEKALNKQAKKHGVPSTYTDYRKMLADPNVQAVVIAVPTQHHASIAIAALEAGKHVLCEMPLATTLAEVDRMLAAAKKAGVILMPSLNFRFTPNYVKAKELIDKGELGKPTAIMYREWIPAADLAMQWPAGSWVWNLKETGGPLFTLAVWSIDLMRWLLGVDFTDINACVEHFPIEKFGDTLGYNAFVNYKFPGGVIGALNTSGSVAHACSTSILEVIGDNTRSIKANWNNELTLFGHDPDKSDWIFREGGGHRQWGHMQMDEHFVDCILEGRQPSISPEDGRRAVEISLKIVGKA
ncbi:MAG: Gfo/Idh/MocA family oxidoreductase [Planctomycetota bacterium]|nr:Gfo/Idh/MocA family oxidoreductase [Planctomycetota bacterium]